MAEQAEAEPPSLAESEAAQAAEEPPALVEAAAVESPEAAAASSEAVAPRPGRPPTQKSNFPACTVRNCNLRVPQGHSR